MPVLVKFFEWFGEFGGFCARLARTGFVPPYEREEFVCQLDQVLGDSDKDRVLTQAKAMVVRDYLAQNFRLDDTRIKTIGLGKTQAMGDTSKVRILIYP